MDAQPPRCRQEGARARDRMRRVLGWLDEDRQLRVGPYVLFPSIFSFTLLTTLFRPAPARAASLLLCTISPSRLVFGPQWRRKPHPPLSSNLNILSHAHSVFGISLPTIEDTHIQNDDDPPTPRLFKTILLLTPVCFYVSHRPRHNGFYPPLFLVSPAPPAARNGHPSHPLPYAILMHLHFHHLHLSPSAC